MNQDGKSEAQSICKGIVVAFLYHLDHKEFSDAASLFSKDAIWHRLSDKLIGREQVFNMIASRPRTQRERHVVTNIHITASDDRTLTAMAYVMTFRTQIEPTAGVAAIAGADGLADFQFDFQKVDNIWKIAELSSRAIFSFGM